MADTKTLREVLSDLLEARSTLACMAQPQLVALDRAVERIEALAAQAQADRCTSCNGTGDLIDHTGEWRGYCVCPDGVALKAQPVAVPDGMALVPVEPTPEMLAAVVTTMDEHFCGEDAERRYRDDWAAMLAAAPKGGA